MSTGALTRVAVSRVGQSAWRRLGAALRDAGAAGKALRERASPHRLVVAVGLASVAVLITVAVWPAQGTARFELPAADRRDLVSFLVRARQGDVAGASAELAVQHARAAVALGEYGEMLEALESAVKAEPALAQSGDFVELALQSFNAGRANRSQALLARCERKTCEPPLQAATADYSYRIRHGAADVLKLLGVPVADPVPPALLDLWQLERCDQRRAVANKLLAATPIDPRVPPGIEAAARRAADDGCLKDLATRARAR